MLCRPTCDYADQPFRNSPEDWSATLARDGFSHMTFDFAEKIGEAVVDLENSPCLVAAPPGTDLFLAEKSTKVLTYPDLGELLRIERAYNVAGESPLIQVQFYRVHYRRAYELALQPVEGIPRAA